jgi:hypothetical protein
MSWDVMVFDAPAHFAGTGDIPEDFRSKRFPRQELIDRITATFPRADFSDPAWGRIDGDGWSIEVNIGDEDETDGFMLHVRGGDKAVDTVIRIAAAAGLRALDISTGKFLEASDDAGGGFRKWRAFRDRVVKS